MASDPAERKEEVADIGAPGLPDEVVRSRLVKTASPPPDGGVQAWLQVLGSFFLWFATLGIVTSFGLFQDYYKQTYLKEYSPSDIAWIGTVQGFLLFGAGIFSGPLFDRGYLRELLIAGTIFMTIGLLTASVARHYLSIFLSFGLCTGVGMSLLFTPSVAVIGTYFTSKRAVATGFSAAGGGVGTVVFTVIFKPLINSVGFSWAVRVLAFIDLASLLIAIAVLRQRPSPTKPRRLIDLSAFGTAAFNTLALGFFLMFCGAYSPFFFVAVYGVEDLRLSQSTSYNMLAILGIGSALGRVFPSFAAQRYGSFAAIALSMLMCGMLQFVWGAVHNLGGLVSFSLFYGFFGGSVAGLSPVVCLEVVPSLQLAGTWIGMLLFLGSIGVLVGNPIVGAILATKSGFGGVQAFSGATLLAGSVLMIVSWECLQRQKKGAASPSNST